MQVDPGAGSFSYDIAGEFAAAMTRMAVGEGARLALAVSGGPDSMALALLLARWSRENGARLLAVTVDHALREAAADEARQVGRWMGALEISHTTLCWDEGRDYRGRAASAQAAAREARYRLLTDYCRANACSHLFLAHHADDQAETFLLRLARGSGVDGLAAMAPLAARGGILLARPLLEIPKDRLTAFLSDAGQPWIEDPSNTDASYARARLRAARGLLENAGLSTERLLATARHMHRARAALDRMAQDLLDANSAWDICGVGRVDLGALLAAPEDVALRALARLLMTGGGQHYRPRFERLERLYRGLRAGPWRDSTLHGCLLQRDGGTLVVVREAAQIDDERTLAAGESTIWDGRFEVTAHGVAAPVRVRRLTRKEAGEEIHAGAPWGKLRLAARETLPAFFDSAGLAAVPSLDFLRPDLRLLPDVNFGAAFICPKIDPSIDQSDADDADM